MTKIKVSVSSDSYSYLLGSAYASLDFARTMSSVLQHPELEKHIPEDVWKAAQNACGLVLSKAQIAIDAVEEDTGS